MLEFIFSVHNQPFAVAIALMLLIALLEGVTTILGMGLSGLLDSIVPDLDVDLDVDGDFQATGPLTRILGWLRIGQVPILVLLVVFLTSFGLIGFGIQSASHRMSGQFLPTFAAVGVSLMLALPVVRICGGILAKIIPRDETEAVSEKSFIGLVAVVTTGKAKKGSPAQGKLTDRYGQTHYVMIEPDEAGEEFLQGAEVLLVRRHGATFSAIRNTSAALRRDQTLKS
jgi:hypothetical protein